MSIPKNSQNPELDLKRHSFAHLMAAAVKKMFPEAQFGVGPVIETGCYYDFILPRTLIPEDLPLIEKHIKELLKQPLTFKVQEMELQEAINLFDSMNQPLKVELLQDLSTRGTTSMSEEEREPFLEEGARRAEGGELALNEVDTRQGVSVKNKLGILPYNQDLKEKAKALRKSSSKMEVRFWCELKNHPELSKIDFHRQKPVLNYILDFYVPEFGIAIELDGESHNKQIEYDKKRTQELENLGLKVLRFNNEEVENDLNGVFTTINKEIDLIKNTDTSRLSDTALETAHTPPASQVPLSRGGLPKITVYRLENEKTGEDLFVDLCKGPHVEGKDGFRELRSLGFKLDKFSGSYWRGDQERNIQMQRIYALVMEDKAGLKEFIKNREEAKKRDHRKLGKDLDIFMVSDEVGAGLPLYLPNGAEVRRLLERYCYEEARKAGYKYVYTPHIGKSDLFARSGHLDHYADGMYAPIDMVNLKGEGAEPGKADKFYLKPMNCPMHHNIYLNKPKSYRDLPYKLYEYGTVYRYEESGTLSGMIRVRGFTQNDAHVYCERDQIKEVIGEALQRFIRTYEDVGITDYKIRFSLPDFINDKEKFGEETQEWRDSVNGMREALDELGIEYYEAIGEAAFYGPKIDIQVQNVNGKEDSLSTIQVDYSIASKFDITYKNTDGEEEVPAIIHMALMGSLERFMAFVIEMTAGWLPFWLAPTQVKILTVNNEEETLGYVKKVKSILDETLLMKPLKYNELRYEVDDRQESLGKKIREATLMKIPVQLIVGPKDIEAGVVSVRTREGEEKVKLDELKVYLEGLR